MQQSQKLEDSKPKAKRKASNQGAGTTLDVNNGKRTVPCRDTAGTILNSSPFPESIPYQPQQQQQQKQKQQSVFFDYTPAAPAVVEQEPQRSRELLPSPLPTSPFLIATADANPVTTPMFETPVPAPTAGYVPKTQREAFIAEAKLFVKLGLHGKLGDLACTARDEIWDSAQTNLGHVFDNTWSHIDCSPKAYELAAKSGECYTPSTMLAISKFGSALTRLRFSTAQWRGLILMGKDAAIEKLTKTGHKSDVLRSVQEAFENLDRAMKYLMPYKDASKMLDERYRGFVVMAKDKVSSTQMLDKELELICEDVKEATDLRLLSDSKRQDRKEIFLKAMKDTVKFSSQPEENTTAKQTEVYWNRAVKSMSMMSLGLDEYMTRNVDKLRKPETQDDTILANAARFLFGTNALNRLENRESMTFHWPVGDDGPYLTASVAYRKYRVGDGSGKAVANYPNDAVKEVLKERKPEKNVVAKKYVKEVVSVSLKAELADLQEKLSTVETDEERESILKKLDEVKDKLACVEKFEGYIASLGGVILTGPSGTMSQVLFLIKISRALKREAARKNDKEYQEQPLSKAETVALIECAYFIMALKYHSLGEIVFAAGEELNMLPALLNHFRSIMSSDVEDSRGHGHHE